MRTIEDGHVYDLSCRAGIGDMFGAAPQRIEFVNREPGKERDGTTTQEVLRALIDRTQYCDHCLPWSGNQLIVQHLRMALALHEARALLRKVERGEVVGIELLETGPDGHLQLPEITSSAPAYAIPDGPRPTETGSTEPGKPCHSAEIQPAPPYYPPSAEHPCRICGRTTELGTETCPKAGCPHDDIPF